MSEVYPPPAAASATASIITQMRLNRPWPSVLAGKPVPLTLFSGAGKSVSMFAL